MELHNTYSIRSQNKSYAIFHGDREVRQKQKNNNAVRERLIDQLFAIGVPITFSNCGEESTFVYEGSYQKNADFPLLTIQSASRTQVAHVSANFDRPFVHVLHVGYGTNTLEFTSPFAQRDTLRKHYRGKGIIATGCSLLCDIALLGGYNGISGEVRFDNYDSLRFRETMIPILNDVRFEYSRENITDVLYAVYTRILRS